MYYIYKRNKHLYQVECTDTDIGQELTKKEVLDAVPHVGGIFGVTLLSNGEYDITPISLTVVTILQKRGIACSKGINCVYFAGGVNFFDDAIVKGDTRFNGYKEVTKVNTLHSGNNKKLIELCIQETQGIKTFLPRLL